MSSTEGLEQAGGCKEDRREGDCRDSKETDQQAQGVGTPFPRTQEWGGGLQGKKEFTSDMSTLRHTTCEGGWQDVA